MLGDYDRRKLKLTITHNFVKLHELELDSDFNFNHISCIDINKNWTFRQYVVNIKTAKCTTIRI